MLEQCEDQKQQFDPKEDLQFTQSNILKGGILPDFSLYFDELVQFFRTEYQKNIDQLKMLDQYSDYGSKLGEVDIMATNS